MHFCRRAFAMTLSDLASIGACISSGGTLVSLIYLAIQVADAKKNQEASIRQGRTNRVCDMNMQVTQSSLADAVLKGSAGSNCISETELQQYRFFCRAAFFSFEDSYFQYQENVLSDAAFKAVVASMKDLCSSPGMRAQWKSQRAAFDTGFAAFMDNLIKDVKMVVPLDALVQWRLDLRHSEMSGQNCEAASG
jgi:hypothetical protein